MSNFFKKCKKLDIYSFDMAIKHLTEADKKFILKNIKTSPTFCGNIDDYNSIVIHVEDEDFCCYFSSSYEPFHYALFKKLSRNSFKNKLK